MDETFWGTASKLVGWIGIALVLAVIVAGVLGYLALKAAISNVKDIVQTVKTATNRTVDSIVETLKTTQGVLQGVQHSVGDLVAVIGKAGEKGIYEITDNFNMVKKDVDRLQHYITDGDWKGTHFFADFQKDLHQVANSIISAPVDVLTDTGVRLPFKLHTINSAFVYPPTGGTTPVGNVKVLPFTLGEKAVSLENDGVVNFASGSQQAISWSDLY